MIARQKVATACDNCRRRKVKCDAQQPICNPCSIRKVSRCVYSQDKEYPRKHRPLLPHSKIVHGPSSTQSPNKATFLAPFSETAMTRTSSEIPPANSSTDVVALGGQTGLSPGSGAASKTANGGRFLNADDSPKNTKTTPATAGEPSPSVEFFGSSSADSFMRQINSAIDARLGRSQTIAFDLGGVYPSRTTQASDPRNDDTAGPFDYTLPQRRLADSLLEVYYDLVWAVLPIHDRTVFQEAYNSVWLESVTAVPERIFHCMMNLTFALGSQFSADVEPNQRKEVGQTFWRRAQKLFGPNLHNGASIEGVQCLLMMGLFLQSTCESYQCWMAIGSAIRMAQSLGLHLPTPASETRDFREVEVGRRAWHGCIYMDRMLSMIFGRPSMIAKWLSDPVPSPSMIDDEFLDTQTYPAARRPDGKPTIVAFFIKSLELYSIVNDALLELYMCAGEIQTKEDRSLVSVLQFDHRLVQWLCSLPDHLQYSQEKLSDNLVFRRQQIVLRARYLHARIIVLRPVFADCYLKQTNPESTQLRTERSLSQQLIVECATLCFEAAHEIIDVIYTNFDFETVTGPVPAWWYAVLFVYSAATVLLAERLRPAESKTRTSEQWQASRDRAMALLKAWSRVGESAKRCVKALEILSGKIYGGCHNAQTQAVHDEQPFAEIQSATVPSEPMAAQGRLTDSMPTPFIFDDFNFNDVDDMLWLNNSAADFCF